MGNHGGKRKLALAAMVGGTFHLWRHTSFVKAYLLNRCNVLRIRTLFLNLKSGGYVCRLRVLCVSNLPPIIN